MHSPRHATNGFTIVELLIVIVVIGILAAITIVFYNGIQQKAQNTKVISGMTQYIKALAINLVDKGGYPAGSIACFNGTVGCNPGAVQASSTALLAAMKTSIPGAPLDVSPQALMTYGGTTDYVKGGTYTGYYVLFPLTGSVDCPSIAGARYVNNIGSTSSLTQCRLALPDA